MIDKDNLLIGGIQKSNWDDIPIANPIQSYVDNNQQAINNLSETNPLRYAAQVPQDYFNVIAHPIQSTKDTFNYFKENPMRLNAGYLAGETLGNIAGQTLTQPLNVSLAQISGNLLGNSLMFGGLGLKGVKTPTVQNKSIAIPKVNIPEINPTKTLFHGSPNQNLSNITPRQSGKYTPAVAERTVSLSEDPVYASNYALQEGRAGSLYKTQVDPTRFIDDSTPINRQLKQQQLLEVANRFGYKPNTTGLEFWNNLQRDYNPLTNNNIPLKQYLNDRGIEGVHFINGSEYASINDLPVMKVRDVPYTSSNMYRL